jgi:hypothetical protein
MAGELHDYWIYGTMRAQFRFIIIIIIVSRAASLYGDLTGWLTALASRLTP